eukprot:TRINITY_DN50184_c0_g1_i1.p1 TRINITY_DN50184_c0_g1~~TRINITY_DN50184_c0_g1_i1.p1  ORF type:complete len:577 (-),score=98.05 TRINITY_DN50184_c0_g1_i1:225-1955(-)
MRVGNPSDDGKVTAARPSRTFTCCALVASLLFLAAGVFHFSLYKKFTPVYTSSECGNQLPTLDRFDIGASHIHVGLRIQVSCRNPNPYSIKILAAEPGRVFASMDMIQVDVGELEVIPGSWLDQYGDGVVTVHMNSTVSGEAARTLLPHFLADSSVDILLELQFNVGVTLSFGLRQWSTAVPFVKKCGLKVEGMLVPQLGDRPRIGPMVCRDSFEELVIPHIGEASMTPADGDMGFSAAQIAPTEVSEGETVKNVSLMTVMGLDAFLCLFLVHVAFYGCKICWACLSFLQRFAVWQDQVCSAAAQQLPEEQSLLSPCKRHPEDMEEGHDRSCLLRDLRKEDELINDGLVKLLAIDEMPDGPDIDKLLDDERQRAASASSSESRGKNAQDEGLAAMTAKGGERWKVDTTRELKEHVGVVWRHSMNLDAKVISSDGKTPLIAANGTLVPGKSTFSADGEEWLKASNGFWLPMSSKAGRMLWHIDGTDLEPIQEAPQSTHSRTGSPTSRSADQPAAAIAVTEAGEGEANSENAPTEEKPSQAKETDSPRSLVAAAAAPESTITDASIDQLQDESGKSVC